MSPFVPVPLNVGLLLAVMRSVDEAPVSEEVVSANTGAAGSAVFTTMVSVDDEVPRFPARSLIRAFTTIEPSAKVPVGATVATPAEIAVESSMTCPITDPPLVSNSKMSFATALVPVSATVKRGCTTDVLLSVLDVPASSSAIKSGAPGADCPVVSITAVIDVEASPDTFVLDFALAVNTYVPDARATLGRTIAYPREMSPLANVMTCNSSLPPNSTMRSPAIKGVPEINTPSTATRNSGRVSLVTLSELEVPVSLADSMSGAPGVPGTRLSTVSASEAADEAVFPSPEMVVE